MKRIINKPKFKVSIVVLNYLNYKDTIECVESALNQSYPIQKIVIVDNGSNNQSVQEIKKYYTDNEKIRIICLAKNLGFAKGNNIGIRYAREKTGADFVLVVNNDTKFIDADYIQTLIKSYDAKTGVIGSAIQLLDGSIQDEYKCVFDLRQCLLYYLNLFSANKGSSFDFQIDNSNATEILHGSSLLFTPLFFQYYKGFYPRTFLHREEEILYLMCMYKKLRQKYVPSTVILHKEDQSSKLSFNNDLRVIKRYQYQSYKYVLFWIIKCKLRRRKWDGN